MATLVLGQARAAVAWARWAKDEIEGFGDDLALPETDWAIGAIRVALAEGRASTDGP